MSWAFCGKDANGRDIGYGVTAICDEPGCAAEIDRGLGHLCGQMHEDGGSCNGYFCGGHLLHTPAGRRCRRCADQGLIEDVMES